MGRPKKQDKLGAPYKFTPKEFDLAWQQYFQYVDDNPWYKSEAIKSGEMVGQIIKVPTARPYSEVGFCAFHNLGEKYITELANTLDSKTDKKNADEVQLSNILTQARARCRAQKFEGAAVGAFNANIIARDLGMIDKTANDNLNINQNVSLTKEEIKEIHDALNSEY